MQRFCIRQAEERDTGLILELIQRLAEYEKMADLVAADEATLHRSLFEQRSAEVLIGEEDGAPVAYALFFHNFSTFKGRRGLYLEDIFVLPEKRGRGYGRALFRRLGQIAVERGCGRMEWSCLDWNKPSIGFYRSLGAQPQEEWTIFRLDEEGMERLANG